MANPTSLFTPSVILAYLQLPESYSPSPKESPIDFLHLHIRQLPPHLLLTFSLITTPRKRTVIPTIRNRRLRYTLSDPHELSFAEARSRWPLLWEGESERRGMEEGQDEKDWVQSGGFMDGSKKHVGKLGTLLGDYEEEREAERIRAIKKERAAEREFIPEEDSDSDSDMENEELKPEEARVSFERLVREQFIYGLLDVGIHCFVYMLFI